MRKRLSVTVVIAMSAAMISACGSKEAAPDEIPATSPIEIEENTTIANPWRDCSEEEASKTVPNCFSAPEGAVNVRWSICEPEKADSLPGPMVQLEFDYDDQPYTAREQAVAGEEIVDISGMYYDWTVSDDETLPESLWGGRQMPSRCMRYVGEDEYVDVCLWFDIETGYAYSLSTKAPDLDGFDIYSMVEAIYDPAKQDSAMIPDDDGSADKLPAYVYTGEDELLGSISMYMVNEYAGQYPAADVSVPCTIIIAKDESDTEDIKVWGNFCIYNYDKNGDILECKSGGSYPGLAHLKQTDAGYDVNSIDVVLDGSNYDESAKKIFGDHYEELIKSNGDEDANNKTRTGFIVDYVRSNNLPITAYQDYGWDPVPLK